MYLPESSSVPPSLFPVFPNQPLLCTPVPLSFTSLRYHPPAIPCLIAPLLSLLPQLSKSLSTHTYKPSLSNHRHPRKRPSLGLLLSPRCVVLGRSSLFCSSSSSSASLPFLRTAILASTGLAPRARAATSRMPCPSAPSVRHSCCPPPPTSRLRFPIVSSAAAANHPSSLSLSLSLGPLLPLRPRLCSPPPLSLPSVFFFALSLLFVVFLPCPMPPPPSLLFLSLYVCRSLPPCLPPLSSKQTCTVHRPTRPVRPSASVLRILKVC